MGLTQVSGSKLHYFQLISTFTIFLSVGVVLLSTVGGCAAANGETSQCFLRKLQLAAVLTAVTSVLQIFVARVFFKHDLSLPGGKSDYYYEKVSRLNYSGNEY